MNQAHIGRWSFVIGLIISILLGFITLTYASIILVILGLIVGFMNVTEKEAMKFLMAVVTLIIVGVAGLQAFAVWGNLYSWIQEVLTSFITFVSAAGVVVAIKMLFETAKES